MERYIVLPLHNKRFVVYDTEKMEITNYGVSYETIQKAQFAADAMNKEENSND